MMTNGSKRFKLYLDQLEVLLKIAVDQENPALWLYSQNARTPFFMLEGLAKLYAGILKRKRFGKLKEQFKVIEDGLGQIDYYDVLVKSLSEKPGIPEEHINYLKSRLEQSTIELNEILSDKGWLSKKNKRINKIRKKLKSADWMDPVEETDAISVFYKASIAGINEFLSKNDIHFDNVEEDVHELRRKLRWLSIYPQALQGVVQYAPAIKTSAHLGKYLTSEIVNSPFNRLPDPGNNTAFLLVHKNYFLALSWMIAKLGTLKDEGLQITGLCEAIKQKPGCHDEESITQAQDLLGGDQRSMKEILNEAEEITRTFFKEDNLHKLISKTTTNHTQASVKQTSET